MLGLRKKTADFLRGFFIKFINTPSLRAPDHRNKLAYRLPWCIPVGERSEGIILLKADALMRCYEFTCPDLDSAGKDRIIAVSEGFNAALRHLGEGWSWHVEAQRIMSTEYPSCTWTNVAGYVIDKRREEAFTAGSRPHFINRYILSVTYHLPASIYSKAKDLLYSSGDGGRKQEGYYSLDELQKQLDIFRGGCQEKLSYISSAVSLTPLGNDECVTYLHTTCSTSGGKIRCPQSVQFIDSYITDCDYTGGTCIKIGDYYCPIVSVRVFPNDTYPAMLQQLTTCSVEMRWSTRFIGIDRETVRKLLSKYQKRFYASTKSWSQLFLESTAHIESTRTDPTATEHQNDAEDAMNEEAADIVSFGYYTSSIMVWDKDYDTAMQKAHYIAEIVNKATFTSKIETINSYSAWLGMMPGNVRDNIRRAIVSTGNTANIIPLSSMWQGMRRNYHTEQHFSCSVPLLTCGTYSGTPFYFNLNVRDVGHAFVFGPTGAGKSTLLCLLESQFLKYRNANVIILDKDKSARGITLASGGIYIEPGLSDCSFQPLRDLESAKDISWCAEFIEELLTEQHVTVNASMREQIVKTLNGMRDTKSKELRTISTFQQYVMYQNRETGENDIALALEPYTTGGQYGAIFDASESSVSLTKWLMIEMGTLMKMGSAAVTPALMCIFRLIERIYTNDKGNPTGDPTLLVLDESWMFLDNAFFRAKIEDWLLTLRKYNVMCVFATQEVSRIAASKIATTIISQCKTKIYLADDSARTDAVAESYRKIDLTEDEIDTIKNGIMKRDYYYKSALGCRLFQLDLDDFQLALLAPGNDVCDAIEAQYGVNTMKPLALEMLAMKGFASEARKYFGRNAA